MKDTLLWENVKKQYLHRKPVIASDMLHIQDKEKIRRKEGFFWKTVRS